MASPLALLGEFGSAAPVVDFQAPADGTWHPAANVSINGTAGNATIDTRTLAEGSGLENGTHNGTEFRSGVGVTPSSTNLTTARFFSNFSYPEGTHVQDPEPMWVMDYEGWVASDAVSSILADPPSLVGGAGGSIEWHAVFPSSIVSAAVSFRYA